MYYSLYHNMDNLLKNRSDLCNLLVSLITVSKNAATILHCFYPKTAAIGVNAEKSQKFKQMYALKISVAWRRKHIRVQYDFTAILLPFIAAIYLTNIYVFCIL